MLTIETEVIPKRKGFQRVVLCFVRNSGVCAKAKRSANRFRKAAVATGFKYADQCV